MLHEHNLFVSNLVNGVNQYVIPTMERMRTNPYTIIRNYAESTSRNCEVR